MAAAKAAGVRKFVLVSCFMVSGACFLCANCTLGHSFGRELKCSAPQTTHTTDRARFSLTRFFMNVGPKWRMMDHKWAGECAVREAGIPYSIVRPGALFLTQDGAGGSTGNSFVITASQGGNSARGRISKSDLAGVCASCALDFGSGLNATFDVAQVEPPVRRPRDAADDGTRYDGLRRLVADTDAGAVVHNPWFGLLGTHVSSAAPEALAIAGAGAPAPAAATEDGEQRRAGEDQS